MKKYYLTTAISYVNGLPYIGHMIELLQADFLARYKRSCGFDVYFLTGTDEHGSKIYETAEKEGHLIIFNRDPEVSWDEKIFIEEHQLQNNKIHVWGM